MGPRGSSTSTLWPWGPSSHKPPAPRNLHANLIIAYFTHFCVLRIRFDFCTTKTKQKNCECRDFAPDPILGETVLQTPQMAGEGRFSPHPWHLNHRVFGSPSKWTNPLNIFRKSAPMDTCQFFECLFNFVCCSVPCHCILRCYGGF